MATIAEIRALAFERLSESLASPKPSYSIDGQTVNWDQYRAMLLKTLETCDKLEAAASPVEIRTTAAL